MGVPTKEQARRPTENDPKYAMQRNGMGQLTEAGRAQFNKDVADYEAKNKPASRSNQSDVSASPHYVKPTKAPKGADIETLNREYRAQTGQVSGSGGGVMPLTIGKNAQTGKTQGIDINTGRAAVTNDDGKVEVVRADSLPGNGNTPPHKEAPPEEPPKSAAPEAPAPEEQPQKEIGKQGGKKDKPDDFKNAIKHTWGTWKGGGRDVGERLSRMAYGGSGGKYGHWAEQERGHEMTKEIMSSDQNFQERMKDKDFANAIAMVDKNFANDSYFRSFDRQTAMALQSHLAGLEAAQIPMLMTAIKESGYSPNQIAEQMRAQGGKGFIDTWIDRAGAATGAAGNLMNPMRNMFGGN